jgi:hypothetical protein
MALTFKPNAVTYFITVKPHAQTFLAARVFHEYGRSLPLIRGTIGVKRRKEDSE